MVLWFYIKNIVWIILLLLLFDDDLNIQMITLYKMCGSNKEDYIVKEISGERKGKILYKENKKKNENVIQLMSHFL